jgi:hypothetical protein
MAAPVPTVYKATTATVPELAGGNNTTTYSVLFVVTNLFVLGIADAGQLFGR